MGSRVGSQSLGSNASQALVRRCDQCGTSFEYFTWARFCSGKCKSAYRRTNRLDYETRVCRACGENFECNRYFATGHCSKKCAWITRRTTTAEGVQPGD